jgi:hypothetical protein
MSSSFLEPASLAVGGVCAFRDALEQAAGVDGGNKIPF